MNNVIAFFYVIMALSQQVLIAENDYHVDVRISAFLPSNKLMRQIYGDCQVNYEIEAGRLMYPNYEIWGNISYLYTNGRTQALLTRTQFTNANLSCGAKYIHQINSFLKLYFGAGINGSYVYVYDDSACRRYDNKGGVGGIFKLGTYFRPRDTMVFELFTDYLYQKIHFEQSVQIGGLRIGAGAVFVF